MLTKRVIPCLDVANGRVVRGVRFSADKDAGEGVKLEQQILIGRARSGAVRPRARVRLMGAPHGHKLLLQEPLIADESMRSAASWAEKLSAEVIDKMRAEMKKRGHEI